ncbi:YezD family protein [Bacillus sp. FJAT-27231]|uniref:YezD family protein n=1 Tax=Bacillus sp. FJAT-27231 TaxID=1679168 RepID=UPI003FA48DE4
MICLDSKERIDQQILEKIKSLLESLDYGTVQITIHDSQVTQIDKLEKYRLPLQKSSRNTR